MANVLRFFSFLTSQHENQGLRASVSSYNTALNLYAKSDIYQDLDADALKYFCTSFKLASTAFADIKDDEHFEVDILKHIPDEFHPPE